MTELQLYMHFNDRIDLQIESCSCEACDNMTLEEVDETLTDIHEHWHDVLTDTY